MYHRGPAMPNKSHPPHISTPQHKLPQETTRLAPSPTGALHLGNARTFLINWIIARQRGWRIVLRLEDLDGPRIKPGAIDSCIQTLRWLGMDWDEGPRIQSDEPQPAIAAMKTLASRGLVYPCELTRREIEEAATAPHAPPTPPLTTPLTTPHEKIQRRESYFPASLRPTELGPRSFDETGTNWRLLVPEEQITFTDGFVGSTALTPAATIGDFVVWTKRHQPAYQLAVVVDDHRQGVTQVVRGSDLLDSAARQLLLYRALGFAPEPSYTHLPLVLGPDGRRLAKRHGDTRLATYQAAGVAPERVVGLLAHWCGLLPKPAPISADEFCTGFDLATMPKHQVTFTEENDSWLRDGSHLSD